MGAPLHPEAKRIILRLSNYFQAHEVAYWLDLHPETVRRIRRLFDKTGDVVNPNKRPCGRHDSLRWEVIVVSTDPMACAPPQARGSSSPHLPPSSPPPPFLVSTTFLPSFSVSFHQPRLLYVKARLLMLVRVDGCSSPATCLYLFHSDNRTQYIV